jgi:BTB/POZ domain-containing protein
MPPPPPPSGPDPEPNPDSGSMRRHPDFWLYDGSVIIQVEKSQFKLHQSTLQKYSECFAATFRDEPSPDSLPVYRVTGTDTTADDFAALLTVIEGM